MHKKPCDAWFSVFLCPALQNGTLIEWGNDHLVRATHRPHSLARSSRLGFEITAAVLMAVFGQHWDRAPDGVGYTEKEYRLALEIGKPAIAFLHKTTESLSVSRSERTDEGQARLVHFRNLLQSQLCKYWTSAAELGNAVSTSMAAILCEHPAVGWILGDAPEVTDSRFLSVAQTTSVLHLFQQAMAYAIICPFGEVVGNQARGQPLPSRERLTATCVGFRDRFVSELLCFDTALGDLLTYLIENFDSKGWWEGQQDPVFSILDDDSRDRHDKCEALAQLVHAAADTTMAKYQHDLKSAAEKLGLG